MSIFEPDNPNMEAIDFQKDDMFYKELVIVFAELLEQVPITQVKLSSSPLSKIIQNHTSMQVNPVMVESTYPNAYFMPPQLSHNHPLIKNTIRQIASQRDAEVALGKSNGTIKGGVDRRTGRVFGVFKDLPGEIGFTTATFNSGLFSPEELAAITLHECGHGITYFEFLANEIQMNNVLHTSTQACLGTGDVERRVAILSQTEKALNINIPDKKGLAESQSKEVYETVIISANREQLRSELGANIYDERGWEQLADQYAARQGAAVPLTTGLAKIYGKWNASYISTPTFLMLEVAKTIGVILFTAITTVGAILPIIAVLMSVPPIDDTYDRPKERFERLRKQLVEALKDKTNTASRVKSLVADIKLIEESMKVMKDKNGLYYHIWRMVSPNIRRQANQIKDQQILEDLINNDLFYSAGQFQAAK